MFFKVMSQCSKYWSGWGSLQPVAALAVHPLCPRLLLGSPRPSVFVWLLVIYNSIDSEAVLLLGGQV